LAHLLQDKTLMFQSYERRLLELREELRRARASHPRVVAATVAAFTLVSIVWVVGSVWLLASLWRGLPDVDAVRRIGEMDQSTALFDASDQLAFTIYKEQRIEVPLSDVSPHIIHALLATEDQHFYDHHGFDLVRIGAAAVANLRHRRAAQGASTITQQLARQSFLTPDKTIHRKLQELILAERIERLYSKSQILELYLNKVYFGDGLYGVEAASRGYFGKHASEVTVSEAALLAGLVKSPSSYAPTVNLERSKARRNVVLQLMLDTGAIDRETWKQARADRVALHDSLRIVEPHGEYFKEQVRRELVDRFGWQRVYQGGLRVFTTIDMSMQTAAEAAVAGWLPTLEKKRQAVAARRGANAGRSGPVEPGAPLQAALVALDPATGHVRAMVGGRDFDESHFNRATQAKRQPGSAFKPFVYAAALEAGFTPASIIDRLNDPISTVKGAWTPEDEHSTASEMTLRTGLRTSSNRAAVRLLQEVGIPRAVQYAQSMGVGELPNVPSLALGSGEVTLQALTAAYGAFANHGLASRPMLIRRVEDRNGVLLYQPESIVARAISETTAFLMTSMMADVINAGTGARARQLGFKLPAAGKTGTTNDFADAWFVGFTPKLVAGVWVGFDQPHTILPNGFAADVAVPLWTAFMKTATAHDAPDWYTPPPGVITATVCRISGKLASAGCQDVEVINRAGETDRRSMAYTEYFVRGTEPTSYCDLHATPSIFGRIAGLFGADSPRPAPMMADEPAVAPVPAPAASSGVAEPAPTSGDASKKKRGFWSRLLGLGKDKDPKPEQEPPPRKKGG
jgi:1A family penicillin-binding protein